MTRSANDAAVVIAEALGGDEDDFAKLMTRKARALGMTRTVYRNASGLPDDEQVTTARDQSILGRAIQDRFPRYYHYFSTAAFNYHGQIDPQPQSPARQCRGRRRHQDRLHPRFRLQSRDLDAPRQPPSGRRRHGRPQRRFARRHHAQPAGGKPGQGRRPRAPSPRSPSAILPTPMPTLRKPKPSHGRPRRYRSRARFRPRRHRPSPPRRRQCVRRRRFRLHAPPLSLPPRRLCRRRKPGPSPRRLPMG